MWKLFLLVVAIAGLAKCATPDTTVPSTTPNDSPASSAPTNTAPASSPPTNTAPVSSAPTNTAPASSASDQTLANAFQNRTSNLQVQGSGKVNRILADDNDGSRHQKFLLQLGSGQTLLVAHNIDLAPRIGSLNTGDTVEFYGEYEWNEKGGVIHWTHHDPAGKHVGGWLSHNGKRYE